MGWSGGGGAGPSDSPSPRHRTRGRVSRTCPTSCSSREKGTADVRRAEESSQNSLGLTLEKTQLRRGAPCWGGKKQEPRLPSSLRGEPRVRGISDLAPARQDSRGRSENTGLFTDSRPIVVNTVRSAHATRCLGQLKTGVSWGLSKPQPTGPAPGTPGHAGVGRRWRNQAAAAPGRSSHTDAKNAASGETPNVFWGFATQS